MMEAKEFEFWELSFVFHCANRVNCIVRCMPTPHDECTGTNCKDYAKKESK